MCIMYVSNFQFLPTHMCAADWTEKRDCAAEESVIGHSRVLETAEDTDERWRRRRERDRARRAAEAEY